MKSRKDKGYGRDRSCIRHDKLDSLLCDEKRDENNFDRIWDFPGPQQTYNDESERRLKIRTVDISMSLHFRNVISRQTFEQGLRQPFVFEGTLSIKTWVISTQLHQRKTNSRSLVLLKFEEHYCGESRMFETSKSRKQSTTANEQLPQQIQSIRTTMEAGGRKSRDDASWRPAISRVHV